MLQVNTFMSDYEKLWHPYFDSMILVGIEDPAYVYKWREQAETTQRRSKGLGAMSQEEIVKFCSRYMPSYHYYMDNLLTQDFFPGGDRIGSEGTTIEDKILKNKCLKFYLD